MHTFLGIEIGGTKLQLVRGDDTAKILERIRLSVDPGQGADGIKKQIREALGKMCVDQVSAIGIGFGGPVDHQSGRIIKSYQVGGWADFVLREWLEDLTGIPVWIDNDANVASLGESLCGAGAGRSRVFYITMGSGVGAGIVLNGEIYHGAKNGEAEFGHIRLDRTGRTVESSCSGWAVDGKIRNQSKSEPGSVLSELTRALSSGEARVLTKALELNDAAARRILDETTDDAAFALSHVVHLINPEIVILGGGLSLIGEPLRRGIEAKLPAYLMDALRPGPSVQLSALKEDAVPVGALALAIYKTTSA